MFPLRSAAEGALRVDAARSGDIGIPRAADLEFFTRRMRGGHRGSGPEQQVHPEKLFFFVLRAWGAGNLRAGGLSRLFECWSAGALSLGSMVKVRVWVSCFEV